MQVSRFELNFEDFVSKEIGLTQSREWIVKGKYSGRKERDHEETGLMHYLGSTYFPCFYGLSLDISLRIGDFKV